MARRGAKSKEKENTLDTEIMTRRMRMRRSKRKKRPKINETKQNGENFSLTANRVSELVLVSQEECPI